MVIVHSCSEIPHSMSILANAFNLRNVNVHCPAHQKPSPALGLVDSLTSSSVRRAQSLISECPWVFPPSGCYHLSSRLSKSQKHKSGDKQPCISIHFKAPLLRLDRIFSFLKQYFCKQICLLTRQWFFDSILFTKDAANPETSCTACLRKEGGFSVRKQKNRVPASRWERSWLFLITSH